MPASVHDTMPCILKELIVYTKNNDPIFEPITIGNVEIKNRIAMAPMNMNYTGPQRYVSDQQLAYFVPGPRGHGAHHHRCGEGHIASDGGYVSEVQQYAA